MENVIEKFPFYSILYRSRSLYQYNEDAFFNNSVIRDNHFSTRNFTCKQREAFNWKLLYFLQSSLNPVISC